MKRERLTSSSGRCPIPHSALSHFEQPKRGWAHPMWAAYTFPVVATGSVAMLWQYHTAVPEQEVAPVFALLLGIGSLVFVGGVVVLWLGALPFVLDVLLRSSTAVSPRDASARATAAHACACPEHAANH